MKNIIKILTLFVALFIFSGCSPTSIKTETVPKVGSILKSINSGETWTVKARTDSKTNIADEDILSIAINPYDANNVFFGTKSGGIIKTTDGGETLMPTNFISEKVYGLVLSPIDGRTIYASGVWQKRGKIWKSIDGGENWTEIYTFASEGPLVINLTIDKRNEKIIYASTSDNQVLKSLDAGASWKNIFKASAPVLQVAIDSGNSNLIYLNVMGHGIFRSSDGGIKTEDISKKILKVVGSSSDIKFIETDPSLSGWIYATGRIGIIRSKDGGYKWEKVQVLDDAENFPVTALAVNPKNSNEIIYGAVKAIYWSKDQGLTWAPFQLESSKAVKVLKYSSADQDAVFAGMSN